MVAEILIACIGFVGTICGSIIGVLTSAKLTNYRIGELEKKVDKHNKFAERLPVVEEQIKMLNHRVADLESED